MENANRVPRPEVTLGEYLDECEDLAGGWLDWMHLESLAEFAIVDRATLPRDELDRIAESHRRMAGQWFDDPTLIEFRRVHLWTAELLTDDGLAERFIEDRKSVV